MKAIVAWDGLERQGDGDRHERADAPRRSTGTCRRGRTATSSCARPPLALHSDHETTSPYDTDPQKKNRGWFHWRANGMPSVVFTLRDLTHAEYGRATSGRPTSRTCAGSSTTREPGSTSSSSATAARTGACSPRRSSAPRAPRCSARSSPRRRSCPRAGSTARTSASRARACEAARAPPRAARVPAAASAAGPPPLTHHERPAAIDLDPRQRHLRRVDRRPLGPPGLPLHDGPGQRPARRAGRAEGQPRRVAPARQRPRRRHRAQPRARELWSPGPHVPVGEQGRRRPTATTAAGSATSRRATASSARSTPTGRRARGPSASSARATSATRPASTAIDVEEARVRAVGRRPAAAARRDDPQHVERAARRDVVRVVGRQPVPPGLADARAG